MARLGTRILALPLAAALVAAAGCTEIEQSTGIGTEAQTGAVAGAAAGGLLAAAVGASTGWVIASVVLGGVAGGLIADYFTDDDKEMAGAATHDSLENKPDGQASVWQNPNSGNSGSATPNETYYQADGTPCRNFTQSVTAGGQTRSNVGTACRAPDGTWQIQG
jgi:surface antigen